MISKKYRNITFTLATILPALGWIFRNRLTSFVRAWYFKFPTPLYNVTVDKNTPIKMSDGTLLRADVYRPATPGKFPTMIARTPYGKRHVEHYHDQVGRLFASQGFTMVIQDVRGKRPSEGSFYPHRDEAADGSDTIAWVIKQTWSDSQVAFYGFSALGSNGWLATLNTKYPVSTLIPLFSSSAPYGLWYHNGVPYLQHTLFWMCKYGESVTHNIQEIKTEYVLANAKDFKSLDKALTGKVIKPYRDFLIQKQLGKFWNKFSLPLNEMSHDLPVLLMSGWFDQFLQTTISDFNILQQAPIGSKKRESCLIIGPWLHVPTRKTPALNLGANANFLNQFSIILKWCQKWMGRLQTLDIPPVSYYLMKKNVWLESDTWPPAEAHARRFYLTGTEEGHLQSLNPKQGSRQLKFCPHHYVPSIGGNMLYNESKDGPHNQNFLLTHNDVLLWSTSPLKEELIVVGAPCVTLAFETSLPSFDLAIKLIDKAPDGKMSFVCYGYKRVEKMNKTAKVQVTEVVLFDTAYVFLPGHSLQIAITHSDFPTFEPNPHLQDISEAEITFLAGSEEGSYIDLAVLPAAKTVPLRHISAKP